MEIIGREENIDNAINTLMVNLEKKTNSKVLTLDVIGEGENFLEILVRFENGQAAQGKVTIVLIDKSYACRIQANFI